MQADFKTMSQSTAEDWQNIVHEQKEFFGKLPDRILTHMSTAYKLQNLPPKRAKTTSMLCVPCYTILVTRSAAQTTQM